MNGFAAAFWAEALKARRSKMILFTAAGFMLLPFAGGLFMVILKNPDQARAMGLITTKAQITAGVADWPSFLGMISQGIGAGGAIFFALITAWVFGREFSDHTAKELLALPTPRWIIVAAKFALVAIWIALLTLLVYVVGIAVGTGVDIPGWSSGLQWMSLWTMLLTAGLSFMLMPFCALFASWGRGYLPPMGWTIVALAVADIISVLGWADWFPWAVPLLVSSMVQSHPEPVALHSYVLVLVAWFVGLAATFAWWQAADQTR